jgi:flagellar hook-associated protein 1 FlgK
MIHSANILGSLHMARRTMAAHQVAVDTAGHNLANAMTPGYTRQRAELVPAGGSGGVDVDRIERVRDRFLDFSLLTEQQTLGKQRAQDSLLQRLEGVFNDPAGEGIGAAMDMLFQEFEALSVNPTERAARQTVVTSGDRLAQNFRLMRERLDQLKRDLSTETYQRVADANALITQVAELNRKIVDTRASATPNDLLDRRDAIVAQLAEVVGVSATDRDDGSVQLALTGSGVLLVDGDHTALLTAALDGSTDTVNVTAGATAIPVAPRSGALAAVLEARNLPGGVLKQAASDLDTLAGAIVLQVNRLHASGAGLTGFTSVTSTNSVTASNVPLTAAGLPFTPVSGSFRVLVHDATGAVTADSTVNIVAGTTTLDDVRAAIAGIAGLSASITNGRLTISAAAGSTVSFGSDTSDALPALGINTFFTGSTAGSIAVNPVLSADPSKVAAARADAAGLIRAGDGSNALALARLRLARPMAGATQTFTEFYGSTVARVGTQARDAAEGVSRQEAAVRVVQSLQQQVSGVSTDEEMINLSQSQTAYAAAARYATTINELIGTLLEMFPA